MKSCGAFTGKNLIVYFIENGPEVKIGITSDLSQRLAAHQTLRKSARFIGAVYGDRKLEKALHSKLKRWHIKGEWFQDCRDVRAAIQNTLNNFEPVETITNDRRVSPIVEITRLLWPTNTAANIAAEVGCSMRAAERYLGGQREWSGDAIAIIVTEILKRHAMRNVRITKR